MRRLAIYIVGLLFVFGLPGLAQEVSTTTADVSAMPAAGLVGLWRTGANLGAELGV